MRTGARNSGSANDGRPHRQAPATMLGFAPTRELSGRTSRHSQRDGAGARGATALAVPQSAVSRRQVAATRPSVEGT